MMLMFEIPRIKVEIARGEEERAKVGSDPGLIWELKQNRALLAMIKGYCKGGTDESVIKALDTHINEKKPQVQKKEHTMIIEKAKVDLDDELKREAKPTEIWKYLRHNLRTYDRRETIICMKSDEMKYLYSNGTEKYLTKESFRKAIKRLRENPSAKKTVTHPGHVPDTQ